DEVLTPDELDRIRGRIREYNQLLREAATADRRLHLVDIHDLVNQAAIHGLPLRGAGPEVTVTTTYTGLKDPRGFDGFVSYDGVHPSDVGYAVVANAVLDGIREHLGGEPRFVDLTSAESIDEKAVFRKDPHRSGTRGSLTLDQASLRQWVDRFGVG
ncbi:MAG: hypothetical protein AB1758_38040, partial [Candidatus Eremiobacterota bacterium]